MLGDDASSGLVENAWDTDSHAMLVVRDECGKHVVRSVARPLRLSQSRYNAVAFAESMSRDVMPSRHRVPPVRERLVAISGVTARTPQNSTPRRLRPRDHRELRVDAVEIVDPEALVPIDERVCHVKRDGSDMMEGEIARDWATGPRGGAEGTTLVIVVLGEEAVGRPLIDFRLVCPRGTKSRDSEVDECRAAQGIAQHAANDDVANGSAGE